MMERLPAELCLRIFSLLDHHNLTTSLQVCRKWNKLASDNVLWGKLFIERWGHECAEFYAPSESKPWKDVFETQDRCDRVGVGLKIIREGDEYYLIHQGEIQRCLGSRKPNSKKNNITLDEEMEEDQRSSLEGISDKILFFIGDLEVACAEAKRIRT